MKFEEQFPSFKGFIKESEKIAWAGMSSHQEFQTKLSGLKEQIIKHCLDKQKVRDYIKEKRKGSPALLIWDELIKDLEL